MFKYALRGELVMIRVLPVVLISLGLLASCVVPPGPDGREGQAELPGSWQSLDVGMPALSGSVSYDDGLFKVHAAGRDIWHAPDEFHFVYQEHAGDFELTAQVVSFDDTGRSAKAGLMVRESLDASARYAYVRLNPESRSRGLLQFRTAVGDSPSSSPDFTSGIPWWLRIVRSGDTIIGYHSSDGERWREAGRISIDFEDEVLVGLAVTSFNEDETSRVVFNDVHIGEFDAPIETPEVAQLDLRGDPDFHPDQLSEDARRWYDRLWEAIEHPDQVPDATSRAGSDNIYNYARELYEYYSALLTAFRITGDLRLLDEIDRLAQIQRSRLADGWRDTLDDTDGTQDGYLNWVDRHISNPALRGKDLTEYNEARAHSILAQIAYVYDRNRDIASPSGVDYGERADFWKYYLTEHFEPKWRERNNVAHGEFPFIFRTRKQVHAVVSVIRYHHYMAKLTGDDRYLSEVARQTDRTFGELRVTEVDGEEAYVWRRKIGGDNTDYLMPTTYVRYVITDVVDYYLEGLPRWSEEHVPVRFANTLGRLLFDGDGGLARDVGGGVARAGYAATDPDDWRRTTPSHYLRRSYALIAPWDPTGKAVDDSLEIYDDLENADEPRRPYVPVMMIIQELFDEIEERLVLGSADGNIFMEWT